MKKIKRQKEKRPMKDYKKKKRPFSVMQEIQTMILPMLKIKDQ